MKSFIEILKENSPLLDDQLFNIKNANEAAEIVLDIFSSISPKDSRPKKAIELVKGFIKNPEKIKPESLLKAADDASDAATGNKDSSFYLAALTASNSAMAAYDFKTNGANVFQFVRNAINNAISAVINGNNDKSKLSKLNKLRRRIR